MFSSASMVPFLDHLRSMGKAVMFLAFFLVYEAAACTGESGRIVYVDYVPYHGRASCWQMHGCMPNGHDVEFSCRSSQLWCAGELHFCNSLSERERFQNRQEDVHCTMSRSWCGYQDQLCHWQSGCASRSADGARGANGLTVVGAVAAVVIMTVGWLLVCRCSNTAAADELNRMLPYSVVAVENPFDNQPCKCFCPSAPPWDGSTNIDEEAEWKSEPHPYPNYWNAEKGSCGLQPGSSID